MNPSVTATVNRVFLGAVVLCMVFGSVVPQARGDVSSDSPGFSGIELLGEDCIQCDDDVHPQVRDAANFLHRYYGMIKRIPSLMVSYLNEKGVKPEHVDTRCHFQGWGWEKVQGSSQDKTIASDFNPQEDIGEFDHTMAGITKAEYAQLTQLYFQKVMVKYENSEDPGLSREVIFRSDSVGEALKTMQKSRRRPLSMAAHLSREDRVPWMKKLAKVAREKYDYGMDPGNRKSVLDRVSGALASKSEQTICLSFGSKGEGQTVIAFGTDDALFRMIDEQGKQFDGSSLSPDQKTSSPDNPSWYFARRGTAISFAEVDHRFMKDGKRSTYEVFRFADGPNYSFSREYRKDYTLCTGWDLLGRNHQTGQIMEVSSVARRR